MVCRRVVAKSGFEVVKLGEVMKKEAAHAALYKSHRALDASARTLSVNSVRNH